MYSYYDHDFSLYEVQVPLTVYVERQYLYTCLAKS